VCTSASRFLRACRREPTDCTPVWIMRQAGRYLPEYRALRARHDFLELCRTPALAADVTLLPVDRFPVDAAILFADILLIVEPMGVGLEFAKGDGPVIHHPVRTREDVGRLTRAPAQTTLAFVLETIRLARAELGTRAPLIGFAGAPFTLASYLIEGGSSRQYQTTKTFMYTQPETWHRLMETRGHHLTRWWVPSNSNARNSEPFAIYRSMPCFAVVGTGCGRYNPGSRVRDSREAISRTLGGRGRRA